MVRAEPALPRSTHPARRWATAAVLAYTGIHFAATGVREALRNFYGDFLAAFPCWRVAHLAGRDSWFYGSLAEQWARGGRDVWSYGPALHLVTFPLFALPTLRIAYLAWLVVNYAFTAGIILLLSRLSPHGLRASSVAVVAVVLLNFNPFYEALVQRNIEILELLLLIGAFTLQVRGRKGWSGALVGAAAALKFLPLIYLPYFVLRKNWRSLGGALAVIVPMATIAEIVLGWRRSWIFMQLAHGGLTDSLLDQSLPGRVARIAYGSGQPVASTVAAAVMLGGGVAVAVLLLPGRRCQRGGDLEWCVLALAMIVLPPHNENYYLLFLVPLYLALAARFGTARARWLTLEGRLTAASFLLTAAPVPMSLLSRLAGRDVFALYLSAGLPLVGTLLLAVAAARCLVLERSLVDAPALA